ncbi:hypothetical protein MHYP_G00009220 [Metynnis hypsauchen]
MTPSVANASAMEVKAPVAMAHSGQSKAQTPDLPISPVIVLVSSLGPAVPGLLLCGTFKPSTHCAGPECFRQASSWPPASACVTARGQDWLGLCERSRDAIRTAGPAVSVG